MTANPNDAANYDDCGFDPGFTRWIEGISPKSLEIQGKIRIPTFTRCPATLSPVRAWQAIVLKYKSAFDTRKRQDHLGDPG